MKKITYLLGALGLFALETQAQITLPFTEGFETATVGTLAANTASIPGIPVWEYARSGGSARLRTNAGAGFYNTGSRAITLDQSTTTGISINYLIGHLDMSNYNVATATVILDFNYMDHGDEASANDRVWVRGNNTDTWIELYDWEAASTGTGQYFYVAGLNLTTALAGAGQNFSATTELRFGQQDNFPANTITSSDGLTVDDIYIYQRLNLDAGVLAVDSPAFPTCAPGSNVWVSIANYGVNILTSAVVQWEVDGTLQTPFNFTGGSIAYANDSSMLIGTSSVTMTSTSTIKAWTQLPNGVAENVAGAFNDTTLTTLAPGISGIYTIGGTTPDYATINDARIDLETIGVCGPTTFNIRAGTYNEQVTFGQILGSSSVNTVTFTSEDAHKDSVLWTTSTATSATRGTITMDGGDYFNFTNLTIENTHTTYPVAVMLKNESNWNTFAWNCLLGDTTPTSTSNNQSVIYSNNSLDHNNTFDNNTIWGGSYGAYMRGVSTTSLKNNTTFTNNWFKNQYRYGAYFYYNDNINVSNNKVSTNSTYTGTTYGLYFGYADNATVINGNEIVRAGNGTKYGIYLTNCDASAINNGLVANNMISLGDSTTSSTIYGIYMTNTGYTNVLNNSVLINTTSTAGRSLYVTGGGANTSMNNNLANYGNGYAVYINSNFSLISSDYNNYYAPNGLFAYANGGARADLAALQAQGIDANSISVNPMFYSNSDLHVCADSLDNMGMISASVTNDFDGNPRNATTPDIGADEFIGMANYSLGADVVICAGDSTQLFGGGTSTDALLWSNGATTNSIWTSTAGNYFVTLTSVCGTGTDTVEVIVETLTPNFTQNSIFLTSVFTNTSTGILGTTTYSWNFGDGDSSTDENPIHIYNAAGTYSVTLTVTSDCGTQTTTIDVDVSTVGMDEIVVGGTFNMYPNPASNNLNITVQLTDNGNATLRITDITGRTVSNKNFGSISTGNTTLPVDISGLNAGTYFVVLTVDNQVFTQKLNVLK